MKKQDTPIVAENAVEAPKSFPSKKLLISLLAAAVALCLLAAALAVFAFVDFTKDDQGGTQNPSGSGQTTQFVYRDSVLSDYINLSASQITGLTVAGFESRVDEVTDENVKKSISRQLLSYIASNDKTATKKKTVAIDYADEVALHILWVEKQDGTRVTTDFFNNAYMTGGTIQIGMENFGADFDTKLMGLIPNETGHFEMRTMGSVAADDVVLWTYTVTESIPSETEGEEPTEKTHQMFSDMRMDLSLKDEAFRNKILDNYGTLGQTFSFEYVEDIDGDGNTETVKYEGALTAVILDEQAHPITATLPEDFFGKNPKKTEYAELNGATLTFYINIDYVIPHAARTYEEMTKNDAISLGFFDLQGNSNGICEHAHKKEDFTDESIRVQYFTCLKEAMLASYNENVRSAKLSLIWNKLLTDLEFTGELPENALDAAKNELLYTLESYYGQYAGQEGFSDVFKDMEDYARYMWGYEEKDYKSYETYVSDYLAPKSVKQLLLVHGIYKNFINDETKLNAEIERLINEQITEYNEYYAAEIAKGEASAATREQVINWYGGELNLRDTAVSNLTSEYLLANNTVDWTLSEDAE